MLRGEFALNVTCSPASCIETNREGIEKERVYESAIMDGVSYENVKVEAAELTSIGISVTRMGEMREGRGFMNLTYSFFLLHTQVSGVGRSASDQGRIIALPCIRRESRLDTVFPFAGQVLVTEG